MKTITIISVVFIVLAVCCAAVSAEIRTKINDASLGEVYVYKIEKGDNPWKLFQDFYGKHGISLAKVTALIMVPNNIKDARKIPIGKIIYLSAKNIITWHPEIARFKTAPGKIAAVKTGSLSTGKIEKKATPVINEAAGIRVQRYVENAILTVLICASFCMVIYLCKDDIFISKPKNYILRIFSRIRNKLFQHKHKHKKYTIPVIKNFPTIDKTTTPPPP